MNTTPAPLRAASKLRHTLLGVVASTLKSTSLSVNHSKSFGGTPFAYSTSTCSLSTPKSRHGQCLPAHNSRMMSFLLPLKPELATYAGPNVRMRRSRAVVPLGLTSLVSHDRIWSAMFLWAFTHTLSAASLPHDSRSKHTCVAPRPGRARNSVRWQWLTISAI